MLLKSAPCGVKSSSGLPGDCISVSRYQCRGMMALRKNDVLQLALTAGFIYGRCVIDIGKAPLWRRSIVDGARVDEAELIGSS